METQLRTDNPWKGRRKIMNLMCDDKLVAYCKDFMSTVLDSIPHYSVDPEMKITPNYYWNGIFFAVNISGDYEWMICQPETCAEIDKYSTVLLYQLKLRGEDVTIIITFNCLMPEEDLMLYNMLGKIKHEHSSHSYKTLACDIL